MNPTLTHKTHRKPANSPSVRPKPPVIFIAAAEPSGDFLAAGVIKALGRNYRFIGLGGSQSHRAGLEDCGIDYRQLHLMGFADVLKSVFRIKRLMNRLTALVARQPLAAVITVDSPDFSIRLAQKLHRKLIKLTTKNPTKFIHIVAPSVWAWRQGRAKKWSAIYHKIYCLLPFEPRYFKTAKGKRGGKGGGKTIGEQIAHPVLANVPLSRSVNKQRRAAKPRILVLAGSRPKEVRVHLPMMLEAVKRLGGRPLTITPPDTPPLKQIPSVDWIHRHTAFRRADAAVAVSGTVTLETAAAGVPTLVVYGGVHPVTEWILKKWILKKLTRLKYISIVNLLAKKPLLKELVGNQCTTANITKELTKLLAKPNRKTQRLICQTLKTLKTPPPLSTQLQKYLAT